MTKVNFKKVNEVVAYCVRTINLLIHKEVGSLELMIKEPTGFVCFKSYGRGTVLKEYRLLSSYAHRSPVSRATTA